VLSEPGEDAAEIVTDGWADDIGGIAGAAFEVAAAEVTSGLQVPDDGLDGGAAAQFAVNDPEDAALLTGEEDATRMTLCTNARNSPTREPRLSSAPA